jgi:hypothetical protein
MTNSVRFVGFGAPDGPVERAPTRAPGSFPLSAVSFSAWWLKLSINRRRLIGNLSVTFAALKFHEE